MLSRRQFLLGAAALAITGPVVTWRRIENIEPVNQVWNVESTPEADMRYQEFTGTDDYVEIMGWKSWHQANVLNSAWIKTIG